MSSATTTPQDKDQASSTRPIQVLSYSEKTPSWFRQNVDYLIANSRFGNAGLRGQSRHDGNRDVRQLYGVYNSQFPEKWFDHITNPINSQNPRHKRFPAKIRPVTILRTNIDLLLGEWLRRPFVYNVQNLGDTGYNRYLDERTKAAQQNLTQHFLQAYLQEQQASGQQLTQEQMQQLQQDPPMPEEVKEEFETTYKDTITIKGQKWLKRYIRELEIRRKQHGMFKDWLIAGDTYSYKGIQNDKLIYKAISGLNLDYDMSSDTVFVEDGEWTVHCEGMMLSQVVDQFYQELTEENLKDLHDTSIYNAPSGLYNHLSGQVDGSIGVNRVPVYHVQWKGKKKIGFLSYMDPETFQMVEDTVDEDYIPDPSRSEKIEWKWVNEVYEGWRIGLDIYVGMKALDVQRNELNNCSTCKLSYNGRKYSNAHAANISVMEIGVPFQILYIIITYILEKTIGKSKGKIVLLDQNTIGSGDEDEQEARLYYADAMGYMLLDRSQPGVDKTWNQYQVLDMGLFDQIKQLIELQQHIKQDWDDIIGINRQRKGQTYASDLQGVNERATFQSTVITDIIFNGFEEFQEREFQGILDLAKFATAKGLYGTYNDDEYGHQIMEIAPEDFMNEELGVFVNRASEELEKLRDARSLAQAMLQNSHKASTTMEVLFADNTAELMQKLRKIELIDQQLSQQQVETEQQNQERLEQMKKDYREFEELLKRETMHEEYQEKQDLAITEGTFNTFTYSDGDANANGVPDAVEAQKILLERDKMLHDVDQKNKDRALKMQEIQHKKKDLEGKQMIEKQKVKNDSVKAKAAMVKARQRPPKPAARKK